MNSRLYQHILAILLVFCLVLPVASTAEVSLPVQLLKGDASGPLKVNLTEPEVRKYAAFDERRAEHLNKLIRHLGLEITVDGENSEVSVMMDQSEIFSFRERKEEKQILRVFSFEPSVISEEKEAEEDQDSFLCFYDQFFTKGNQYLDAFLPMFTAIPEACADRMRTEGTNLFFTGFGKAVQRITVSFSSDDASKAFPDVLLSLCQAEIGREVISGLSFSGPQKIGILYDAEGNIVRISYDGKCGSTPDALRKVSLVWKCLRLPDHQKDSITLKTPAVVGTDKDNLLFERDLDSGNPGAQQYLWNIEIDHRKGKEDKKQTQFTAELNGSETELAGELRYSCRRGQENARLVITPQLFKENNDGYQGTIEITDYSGKIERNRFGMHVALSSGTAVKWLEDAAASKDKNAISAAQLYDKMEKLLIQNLFKLPEEDLIYFSNEIPDSLWQTLVH